MGILEILVVLLLCFWAFGMWGPYHLGPAIHLLLVIVVIVVVIRLIQGRRPLP